MAAAWAGTSGASATGAGTGQSAAPRWSYDMTHVKICDVMCLVMSRDVQVGSYLCAGLTERQSAHRDHGGGLEREEQRVRSRLCVDI